MLMLMISFTIYCSAVRELFEYLPLSNKDFIAQVIMMMTNFRDEYDDEYDDEDDGILMMMMMMMRYHIMTMTLRLHLEVTRR